MEINLKIEAPGLMEAILALAEQLQEHNAILANAPAPKEPIKAKAVEAKKEEPKEEVKEEIVEEVEEVKEVKEETKVDPFYTVDEVRAKFMEKNSGANRPKLKSILTDHGVAKVTDLKEAQFKSVIDALEAI